MASLHVWLNVFGWYPKRTMAAFGKLRWYLRDRAAFRAQAGGEFPWARTQPMLDERDESSGSLGAYFHQDLCVARWIHEANPCRHVDVGSRLDGFIGHLSVFREVEVIDIRPQPIQVPGVVFRQLDLMQPLPEVWEDGTDSLSCLHTIEHFGLGRYGDPIDADGYLKGLGQLKRMVKPGGMMYLSTPMGPQRVEFNAHRVFSARTILSWFANDWEIEKLAVVDDRDVLREYNDWSEDEVAGNFGCHLGVGIVAARKKHR